MSGCAIALIAVAVAGVLAIPILGIVAAVAIPNLLNAIDRGKQKRTMADLRTIGTAIEEYSIDNNHYPTAMNLEALQGLVSPEYTGFVPPADGWAHPFLVESQPEAYRIYSLGKDGVRDGCGDGKTATFEADICFENGQFTQWPEGSQR